jgi:hypothetical protein
MKVEIARRERKKKQVCLTTEIYIKPLISHEPIIDHIIIFEQEQKNRELEKELETTFNFLRQTIISTTAPKPRVIVISNS